MAEALVRLESGTDAIRDVVSSVTIVRQSSANRTTCSARKSATEIGARRPSAGVSSILVKGRRQPKYQQPVFSDSHVLVFLYSGDPRSERGRSFTGILETMRFLLPSRVSHGACHSGLLSVGTSECAVSVNRGTLSDGETVRMRRPE